MTSQRKPGLPTSSIRAQTAPRSLPSRVKETAVGEEDAMRPGAAPPANKDRSHPLPKLTPDP